MDNLLIAGTFALSALGAYYTMLVLSTVFSVVVQIISYRRLKTDLAGLSSVVLPLSKATEERKVGFDVMNRE